MSTKTLDYVGKTLALGWDTETHGNQYRAFQGGFKTLWRDTPEQMYSDVQKIVDCRKEADKGHLPF